MKIIHCAAWSLVVAALVTTGWAGGACCPSKKSQDKAPMSACAKATASLDLTAEQKAKVAEIEATCQAAGSNEESCLKAKEEIRSLLTDEQKAKFDEAWDKAGNPKAAGGCG